MRVAVTAIGRVREPLLAEAAACVSLRFGAECTRDTLAEPETAFDPARLQYSSPLFMKALAERRPGHPSAAGVPAASHVLGITERDLFIPMLTFVFGQAQLAGTVALVSTARLRQEFYGLAEDAAVLRDRLHKEVAHEMGHTLGLVHCPDKQCVMSLSTAISHVDRKHTAFCGSCRAVLDELLARMESNEATLADSGRR